MFLELTATLLYKADVYSDGGKKIEKRYSETIEITALKILTERNCAGGILSLIRSGRDCIKIHNPPKDITPAVIYKGKFLLEKIIADVTSLIIVINLFTLENGRILLISRVRTENRIMLKQIEIIAFEELDTAFVKETITFSCFINILKSDVYLLNILYINADVKLVNTLTV